ncbi:hypothetical protein [Paenibacillus sp. UNC451MF]|uniref:hypothetical protein n=1 Tax=Paenibacillus sp. UNC451MF TaxID=1449063 RepID=UPI0006906855|nr:hypothetical protein [Paenibacillus sp. UNC451MF]
MESDQNRIGKRRFLFNVDILIEDETNGRALEKLLHLLNGDEIKDYQIKEGVELGKIIEKALHETISKSKEMPVEAAQVKQQTPAKSKEPNVPPKVDPHQAIWDQLQQYKQNNSLVRLTVVKGKGIKLNIPCRILNFDPPAENVSVYHVDEKQVYLFKINEIDDFSVS